MTDAPVCNLGARQKRLRLIPSILLFTGAGLTAVVLVFKEIHPVFRLLLFPFFWASILGFLQAKERTCVFFAYKKIRDLGDGPQRVEDPRLASALVRKSQKLIAQALWIALVLSLACFFA